MHYNMMMMLKKPFLLSMFKAVVLLNIYMTQHNVFHF